MLGPIISYKISDSGFISSITTISNSNSSLFNINEGDQDSITTCYHCHDTCYYCHENMASIPHSMQMVKSAKKRYSHGSSNSTHGYIIAQDMNKPYRYSSKMMNAIWGAYNKDSVHNYKSMACDAVTAAEIRAVAQGSDLLSENEHGVYRGSFGELGRAVCHNFLENIFTYY